MKQTNRTGWKGLFFNILFIAIFLTSCSNEETPALSISTGGMQGSYLAAGQTLARIANENRSDELLILNAKSSLGSVANINAISSGESEFGIAQADHQYLAVNGLGDWSDTGPQQDLRAVFNIYVEAVTLVAGADTDIRMVSDLRGKIVDIGSPESGTRRNAIDALNAAGLNWQTDIQAREESLDERLSMFTRGELDAFFYTAAHPNRDIKFATFSVRGARIIPLENIDSIIAEYSFFTRDMIPASIYLKADNKADIETLGINATLLTSANVPDDVVYAITKAVLENLDSLNEFDTKFNALLNGKATDSLVVPIHPGALKYYREIGLDVPQG
ncbi:MAG: TAXI family TRAP transporter solute-binding subunit [Gammaproteobacteria bacterium]|nr:TAXI family TRAP transporter solute-binding subunit [Gammaproteobacteria bacterium]